MTGDVEPIRCHDAAALVKRSPVTIRRWISKGWLKRIGTSDRQALVDRGEVLAVDRAIHRAAKARSAGEIAAARRLAGEAEVAPDLPLG